MGYEDSPAAHLVATHCAICGRALVDALSVETGIGPDCREKHGYNIDCAADARAEANRLVHAIAIRQHGLEVLQAAVQLRALGFEKLADRIIERRADIRITWTVGGLVVESPYNPDAIDAFRKVPGRRWDKAAKVNTFPAASKRAVMDVLRAFYAGCCAVGPKGPFVVA